MFKEIETSEINFKEYKWLLLFTLRTIYNEKFRKEVNVRMLQLMIENGSFETQQEYAFTQQMEQEKLGLMDIQNIEFDIWNDLNSKNHTFLEGGF